MRAVRAPAAAAPPRLHLVHPDLLATMPPATHWAICPPPPGQAIDLIVHGVPRGLHPYVFGASCAAAGLPGLAAGRFRRQGPIVRLTLTDRRMILLIAKFGVAHFSKRLRRVCGWRCVANAPGCGDCCVHQDRRMLQRAYAEFAGVVAGHAPAGPAAGTPPPARRAAARRLAGPAYRGRHRQRRASAPAARGGHPGLRIGSWNVRGGIATANSAPGARTPLKALELLDLLRSRAFDIVAIQETGEPRASEVPVRSVRGDAYYSWYGDPRPDAPGHGLGFFVRHCGLRTQVSVGLPDATCMQCLWLRVRGAGRTPDLYVGNVYLPVAGAATLAEYREALAALLHDTHLYSSMGEVVLMGDFNTRLGRADTPFGRVGQFGEEAPASGEAAARSAALTEFMHAAGMYALNGRRPGAAPEYTRVQHLSSGAGDEGTTQRSVLDYVLAGADIVSCSWQGQCFEVLDCDLPGADHRLLQADLPTWGAAKGHARGRRVQPVFRWRVDRLLAGGRASAEQRAALLQAYGRAVEEELPAFALLAEQQRARLHSGAAGDEVAATMAHAWGAAVTRAAEGTIGRRMIIPGVAKAWWDEELRAAVAARRECHARLMATEAAQPGAVRAVREEYMQLRRRCKQLARLKQRQHVLDMHQDLGRLLCHDPHTLWRRFNQLTGKRGAGTAPQRITAVREDDRVHTDDEAIARVFRDHYADLACPSPEDLPPAAHRDAVERRLRDYAEAAETVPLEADHLGRDFSMTEVATAIKKLKNGKAVHTDGIPNELIKYGGWPMQQLVHTLFSITMACETVDDEWRSGTIVNLFKSGDSRDPGNYRGITLLSCIGKLYCKCVANRLKEVVHLREGQAGFTEGRSCIDNLYTLSDTLAHRHTLRQRTYVFYLDVRKAFDSTWHDGMWIKLLDMGVEGRLWRIIRNMYAKMRSCVLVNGTRTSSFPIQRGTAQGCTLSPLLFNIFVDGLLAAVEQAGFGVATQTLRLGGLMFADDFAGVETSPARLQQLIDLVHAYLRKWGLAANIAKSAVVVYGPPLSRHATTRGTATAPQPSTQIADAQTPPPSRDPRRTPSPPAEPSSAQGAEVDQWHWEGLPIPVTDSYKYLGVVLHSSCTWTAHVQHVISKGTATLAKFGAYLRAKTISRHVRLVMYKQFVRPVLEYGSEVWRPTETQSKHLEAIQLKAARAILGCFDGTPSVAVRAELGLESLAMRRHRARLRWYSSLRGMGPSRLPAAVHAHSLAVPRRARGARVWAHGLRADWEAMHSAASAALQPSALPRDSVDACYDDAPQLFLTRARTLIDAAALQEEERAMHSRSTLQHLPHIRLRKANIQPYLLQPNNRGLGTDLKMRCRTGTLQVNSLLSRRHIQQHYACPLCGDHETVSHFLLHCPAYLEPRAHMLEQLSGAFPTTAAFHQFKAASDEQLTCSLLSDMFWSGLGHLGMANAAVCDFLSQAWDVRQRYSASLA